MCPLTFVQLEYVCASLITCSDIHHYDKQQRTKAGSLMYTNSDLECSCVIYAAPHQSPCIFNCTFSDFTNQGPSIKYVTLFWTIFDPPPPCHTWSHISGPP